MTDAKKCDVCGLFYNGPTKDKDVITTIKFGYYLGDYGWMTESEYDICPDCRKEVDLALTRRKNTMALHTKEKTND